MIYQPRIKGKWKYWFKSKYEMIKDVTFLCDENDRKDKQLKAYENMRKELINIINYTCFKDVKNREDYIKYFDNLMSILNKVGDSND